MWWYTSSSTCTYIYIHTYIHTYTQIMWWYTSFPTCTYIAECLSTPAHQCPLPCRQMGTETRPIYSLTLDIDSPGEGLYTIKAYSANRRSIIAEERILITSKKPTVTPGFRVYLLSEPLARVLNNTGQYGGLVNCAYVSVFGACHALGDLRRNITMVDLYEFGTSALSFEVTTPPPVKYVGR